MKYLVVLWLVLGMTGAGQAQEFADPGLEAAVRESGGEEDLIQLEAGGRGIRELGGIEQLQNLTLLVLADNQLRDLGPLSALSQLTMLDLANNQVEDLAPLSGLRRLTYLNLEYNAVSDLGPLSGLDQLQVLVLDHNPARDLSSLLGLHALAELSLLGNPLDRRALEEQIPALQAKGVAVSFDPPGGEEEEEPVPGTPAWEAVGPQVEPWSLGVHQVVVAPSDPEVIYALTQNGLWQSRDGGAHWARTGLIFQGNAQVFQEDLLVDAQDPLTLYWTDTDWSSNNHEILKSRDGGRYWAPLASAIPERRSLLLLLLCWWAMPALALDSLAVGMGAGADGKVPGVSAVESDSWARIKAAFRYVVPKAPAAQGQAILAFAGRDVFELLDVLGSRTVARSISAGRLLPAT